MIVVGASAGYFSGQSLHTQREQALNPSPRTTEQYNLAVTDIQAGRYKMAIARLNNVLQNEPNFPGAMEQAERSAAAINDMPTPIADGYSNSFAYPGCSPGGTIDEPGPTAIHG